MKARRQGGKPVLAFARLVNSLFLFGNLCFGCGCHGSFQIGASIPESSSSLTRWNQTKYPKDSKQAYRSGIDLAGSGRGDFTGQEEAPVN